MAKIFPTQASVSYRQARNLKQLRVRWRMNMKALPHSDFSFMQPAGCYKHQHGNRGRKCELCPRIKEGTTFKSNSTGKTYRIRQHLTCKSKYWVYLITCKKCSKQYTGKSIDHMHTRHTGHRYEIDNQTSELGAQFAGCGLDQLQLHIIDCVKEGMDMAPIHMEGIWQNRLATFNIHGNINIRNELR